MKPLIPEAVGNGRDPRLTKHHSGLTLFKDNRCQTTPVDICRILLSSRWSHGSLEQQICLLSSHKQAASKSLNMSAIKQLLAQSINPELESRGKACYTVFFAAVGIVSLACLGMFFSEKFDVSIGSLHGNLGSIILIPLFFYLVFMFQMVGPDEIATVTFLGKPVLDVEQGAVIAPPGLFVVHRFTRNLINLNIGDGAEGHETKTSLFCKKSLAVLSGGEDTAKDILERRVMLDPQAAVRFQIKHPSQFLGKMGSLRDAVILLHKAINGVLQREIPKRSIKVIVEDVAGLDAQIKADIQKLIADPTVYHGAEHQNASWGITLEAFQIDDVGLPDDVASALSKAARALKEAEVAATLAAGQASKIRQEGMAKAEIAGETARQKGRGEADAIRAKAEVLTDEKLGVAALKIASLEALVQAADKLKTPVIGDSGGPVGLDKLVSAGLAMKLGGQMEDQSKNGRKPILTDNDTDDETEKK